MKVKANGPGKSLEYVKHLGVNTIEHDADSGSLETAYLPKGSTVSENSNYKLFGLTKHIATLKGNFEVDNTVLCFTIIPKLRGCLSLDTKL